MVDNFRSKSYNYPCSSAEPCASAASCMTGQWQEVRMEGWRPLSSIFALTASAFQRGQSLWFLDRDDLVRVYHIMSHLSPTSCFSQLFVNIRMIQSDCLPLTSRLFTNRLNGLGVRLLAFAFTDSDIVAAFSAIGCCMNRGRE